jgi:hypothetical protein
LIREQNSGKRRWSNRKQIQTKLTTAQRYSNMKLNSRNKIKQGRNKSKRGENIAWFIQKLLC